MDYLLYRWKFDTHGRLVKMTPLINFQELTKSFGTKVLFSYLSFSIFKGERVGLIGPNGAGKSTLLKTLAGLELPDSGEIAIKKGTIVGYVPQVSEFANSSLHEILLTQLQNEKMADYEKEHLIETTLFKVGFRDTSLPAQALSGGWKKRLAIGLELIKNPDILLLDEPTNHLDLEGIFWLEKFIQKEDLTCIIVSHDRYFLQKATTRIIEIDKAYPKGIFTVNGSYKTFLEKKEEFLEAQIKEEAALSFKVRRETDWLQRSPKARTTKSEARITEAHDLIDELEKVKKRNQVKKTGIGFVATERETRKLLVGHNITKSLGNKLLFKGLDFTLSPGTRLGLIGPNGTGKTTFLRLLASEIKQDVGTLKQADALKIVYFDQHRAALPSHLTLKQALSPNSDFVTFHGREIHINGWCQRFLFSPDMLDIPLEKLSGGERARISIAHLMLKEADLLLLDEPTNDLDIQTLEILEESLLDFPGAIVLITHDRFMLDRVCNLFIAFGTLDTTLYADYTQWEESMKELPPPPIKKEKTPPPSPKSKLSHAEKKEYDQIERKIQKCEEEIRSLSTLLEQEEVVQNPKKLEEVCKAITLAETHIEQLYLRWEELDNK